ncbi:MAG: sigma-54-dependent Fis family transcriptional regulator [Deltaproteobacteria bacterium]|nr:sigma-54-dependent Fis family transcriptional regulator [Deltaproteobacteria bacterium]
MASVLVIDDNETIREGVATVIARMGHKAFIAEDGATGMKLFKSRRVDFTITDLKMEGMDGIEVLKAILEKDEDAVVMLITAFGTVETAVDTMKLGAFDFVTKPFTPDVLKAKVNQALEVAKIKKERNRLRAENKILRKEAQAGADFASMVGSSPAMQEVFSTIKKVAKSDSTVLITGESGTGKELVARALHDQSRRHDGPFIKVNCGALAETLLESEMFGHEKGAFTGATRCKLGRFELADGGSIFLDEIGEITPTLQLKLLRVLQEQEFERVGGEETVSVDSRIIAATNENLEALVREGAFREDLYYRLHIVPVQLPPLRERPQDIGDLARHFLAKLADRTGKQLSGITDEALQLLQRYRWPGNVRELENVIEQAMVFSEGEILEDSDLPSNLGQKKVTTSILKQESDGSLRINLSSATLPEILDEVERTLIFNAYEQAGKVKTETARLLGVKTSALYYKLEKYEIE